MSYLWKRGYYVQRSFASKGVFDILAIPPKKRGHKSKALAIQAKNLGTGKCYLDPAERKRIYEAAQEYDGHICICYNDSKHKLKWKLVSPYWYE